MVQGSLSDTQLTFLKNVLSEEGVLSLFIAADRLSVPKLFILKKTVELWLKQTLKKNIDLPVIDIPLFDFEIPKKTNARLELCILKLLNYAPLKKNVAFSKKQTAKKTLVSSPKLISAISKPIVSKSVDLAKKIRFHKSLLRKHCRFCSDSLLDETKLVGCLCIQDLIKNVKIKKDVFGWMELCFNKSLSSDDIQTFIDVIKVN